MSCIIDLSSVSPYDDEPFLEDVVTANSRSPRSIQIPLQESNQRPSLRSPTSSNYTGLSDQNNKHISAASDSERMHRNDDSSRLSVEERTPSCDRENSLAEDVEKDSEGSLEEIDLADTKSEIQKRCVSYQQRIKDIYEALTEGLRSIGETSHQGNGNEKHDVCVPPRLTSDTFEIAPMHAEQELDRADEMLTRVLYDNEDAAAHLPGREMATRISLILTVASLLFALNRRVVMALERRREDMVTILKEHLRKVVGRATAAAGASGAAVEAFGHKRAEMLRGVDGLDVRNGLSDNYRMWFDRQGGGRGELEGGEEWDAVMKMNAVLRQLFAKVELLDGRFTEMEELVRGQSKLVVVEEKGDVGDGNMDEGVRSGRVGGDGGGCVHWKRWAAIAGLFVTGVGIGCNALYMSLF